MSRSGAQTTPEQRVLRMRGLPFNSTEADIKEFFGSSYRLETVKICVRAGKPTGEAWVRFEDSCACQRAVSEKDKQMLGKRYIELFKAKEQDLDTHQPEVSVPGKCSVVRMRGLPFSACISDILDFFKGIPSLDKESVYLVYDSGRPSGEAYIMFSTSEGCAAAMRLHKQKMGSRYIELFPSSNADVQRAAKQRKLRLCKPEGIVSKAAPREKTSSTGEAKGAKPAVAATKADPPPQERKQTLASTTAPAAARLKKSFASIAAGSSSAHEASAWDTPAEDVAGKFANLEVSEDRAPCTTSAAAQASAPMLAAAVPSSTVTPAAASAHSGASAASSFPSDPFPAASDALSNLQYLQPVQQASHLQPRPNGCDVQPSLLDCKVFNESEAARTSHGDAPLAAANSMGNSPLRGATSLFGHDSLGDLGLSQAPFAASTSAAYPIEQRSSELRGAFPDNMGWSVHACSGSVASSMAPQGSSLGSPGQKSMMMHGMQMQQDVPGCYAGLTQGGGQSFSGPSLAGHNRQNVPPNFPQHASAPMGPRIHQDDVWGANWGPSSVPGGIRSLWADVGVNEPKKTTHDAFAAFSPQFHSHSGVPSHQQAPPADVGVGMFGDGWGQGALNNAMNHRMPHVMNQGGMHAMSGTGNDAAFYRY